MAENDLKKQQKEYVTVGLLVLVALFIGISRFKKKEGTGDIFYRKQFNERWKEIEILESTLPEEEKGAKYVLGDEATPFKSPITDKKKMVIIDEEILLPSIALQGMVWNSRRPQAIINGKVYDVNDIVEVDGKGSNKVKIIDISKEGMRLRYKGKEFIINPK